MPLRPADGPTLLQCNESLKSVARSILGLTDAGEVKDRNNKIMESLGQAKQLLKALNKAILDVQSNQKIKEKAKKKKDDTDQKKQIEEEQKAMDEEQKSQAALSESLRKGLIFSVDLRGLPVKMQEYSNDDALKAAGRLDGSTAFVLRQSKHLMDVLGADKVKATVEKYLSCYKLAPFWKSKHEAVAPIPDAEAVSTIDAVFDIITAGQKRRELPNTKTVLHTRGAEVAHIGTELSCLGSLRLVLKGEVFVLAFRASDFFTHLKSVGKEQFSDALRLLAEAKPEAIAAMEEKACSSSSMPSSSPTPCSTLRRASSRATLPRRVATRRSCASSSSSTPPLARPTSRPSRTP